MVSCQLLRGLEYTPYTVWLAGVYKPLQMGSAFGQPSALCGKKERYMNPMSRQIVGLMIAGILAIASTLAVNAQEGDRDADVKALGDCEGCVFDGQDFSERRMMGVNFASAQLSDIVFDRAAMNIAIFDGASLRGVSFDGTDLKGASFVGARLEDVSFDGADLRGAVFEGAILDRTDLQAARLCNTQIPDDIMDNSDCE